MSTYILDIIEWESIGQEMEVSPDLYQTLTAKKATELCDTVQMIKIGAAVTRKIDIFAGLYVYRKPGQIICVLHTPSYRESSGRKLMESPTGYIYQHLYKYQDPSPC